MPSIEVVKLDLSGKVMRTYLAEVLERGPHRIMIRAPFTGGDTPVLDVTLRKGDLFVEAYYDDRWHNIYEVRAAASSELKGWYCNLSRPAAIADDTISWVDLALDLWVWPDGRQAVLDVDEFEALDLSALERQRALDALAQLQEDFQRTRPPW